MTESNSGISNDALGERIRRLRLARDLTLRQVGERAGVSPTHLSEIERGKTSPTVGALARIARALGEDTSRLIESGSGPTVVVTRRSERILSLDGGGALHSFSASIDPCDLTVAEIDIPAGGVSPRQADRGEEFILVLEGGVELTLDDERHLLGEGDAIHYAASRPHRIRNGGSTVARLLWVTSPPAVL